MSEKKPNNIFISMNVFGYEMLSTLLQAGVSFSTVYTLKKEKSQGISDFKDFQPLSKKYHFSLRPIEKVNLHFEEIKKIQPDYIFVLGWSQLIDEKILEVPKYGCIGSHPSLLPKNRGRAAIPWHFINEEKYGGITFFYLDDGCDSGDIVGQKKFSLTNKDNAGTYYNNIITCGKKILKKIAPGLKKGKVVGRRQDHSKANYLLIRREQESFIDFNKQTDKQIFNQVRAVAPIYPLAFALYKEEKIKFGAAKILSKQQQNYSGTPGQIAQVFEDRLWVMAQNKNMIELQKVQSKNGNSIVDCQKYFRVGSHFNRND